MFDTVYFDEIVFDGQRVVVIQKSFAPAVALSSKRAVAISLPATKTTR